MGAKIADVSPEDRARIAVLYKLIRDLEGQVAVTVGNYAGMKDPRVVATPEGAEKHSDKEVYLQVTDGTASLKYVCVIYMDPPGICMQC